MPIIEDPQPRKLLQGGRRGGKSRVALQCATLGHGPIDRWDGKGTPLRRLHRGILTHALDVGWICPTYKQADPLWFEEIQPRFKDKPYCTVHETDKWVQVHGLGRLFVRTFDNADTIRGSGKRLTGLILDECAHFDLRTLWLGPLAWALVDNAGWAIFCSTTNSGPDGNPEIPAPSFFNQLIGEYDADKLDHEVWRKYYFTAFDNPKIKADVLQQTIDEAMAMGGQLKVDEEVYARILEPGSGLAFPHWRRAIHLQPLDMRDGAVVGYGCIGCLDWGSASPGAFYLLLQGPGGRLHLTEECYFNGPDRADWKGRLNAKEMGAHIAKRIQLFHGRTEVMPEYIAADSAMWAVTGAGATIAHLFQEGLDSVLGDAAVQLVPTPKGPGSRATRKELLYEALSWTEDPANPGRVREGGEPLLTATPDCTHFARTIAILANDPADPEKVADGEDHAFDAVTYGLHTMVPEFHGDEARTRAQERDRRKLDELSRHEAEAYDAMVKKAERDARRGRRRSP